MHIMRAACRRPIMPIAHAGGETVGVGEIDSEAPPGPEMWSMDGIVYDDVPPVQTPLFCAFRLLAGLSDDALGILDNLVRADRALDRILGFLVSAEGRFKREKSGEQAHGRHYSGEHQAVPPE